MTPFERYLDLYRTFAVLKLIDESVKMQDAIEYCEKFYALPKIVVVGTNPSRKSLTTTPFDENTKSGATVRSWFDGVNSAVVYRNLYNDYTKDNKLPDKSSCEEGIRRVRSYYNKGYKIVGCGSFVDKMLTQANIAHFSIPHPSGLCRFWNDKAAGEAKIKEMLEWIKK